MRLIVKYDNLIVSFSKIEDIINHDDYIALTGNVHIIVNGVEILSVVNPISITKSFLLAAEGVFLDIIIQEVNNNG